MNAPSAIKQLVKEYEDYARRVLRPNRDELKKTFRQWKDPNHWARHTRMSRLPAPSPVQRAVSRIKRPESVIDKLLRKPSSFPEGLSLKSVETMYDALGGRIIVYFLSNLSTSCSKRSTGSRIQGKEDDSIRSSVSECRREALMRRHLSDRD